MTAMINRLGGFVLFISFSLTLKAQVTYPIPYENASWGQVTSYGGGNTLTDILVASGDTLIGGWPYLKIDRHIWTGNIEREGLLRQDYSNGKVWRLFDSVEVLIYNFLALPGDTVEVFNTPGSSNTFVIDSVNMIVLNNGEARNRLYPRWVAGSYFSNFPLPLEWIEGIGSNAGLFRPSGGELVGASLWLSCFTQNDTVKYGDSCNVFLDVESLPNTISINIYPNPNNSTFKIQLPKHVVGTSHITVQNTIGQIVFHTTVESANGLVEVNLNNVTNGFYMITVRRDDGVYNAKLLIEK